MRNLIVSICLLSVTLPLTACVVEPARVDFRSPVVMRRDGYDDDRGYDHHRGYYGHRGWY